jgi:hypothetical protein
MGERPETAQLDVSGYESVAKEGIVSGREWRAQRVR